MRCQSRPRSRLRVFVPDACAQYAAPSLVEQRGPLPVDVRAETVLSVVAVAVRLHRARPRVARRIDLRPARAVVVEDVGRRTPRHRSDGRSVAVHEPDHAELGSAPHRRVARQLRLGSAPVVHHVDDVGGQPVAPSPVAMAVHARAEGKQLADGPVGPEIGECVLAPRLPAGPVELVQVGHARPVADQAVPARVGPEVRVAVESLIDVLVDVVVGEVACQVDGAVQRHDLGSEVLPLVPRRALHPVGRLLPDRGRPRPASCRRTAIPSRPARRTAGPRSRRS